MKLAPAAPEASSAPIATAAMGRAGSVAPVHGRNRARRSAAGRDRIPVRHEVGSLARRGAHRQHRQAAAERPAAAALERDGAPPLYYVLLHGWMRVFGTSDVRGPRAVGCPRGGDAAAGVPGRPPTRRDRLRRPSVGGVERGAGGGELAVRHPVLDRSRACTCSRWTSCCSATCAVHAAFGPADRARLAAVALVTGALLYTQYWAFFLVGVFGALMLARALVRTAIRAPRPRGSSSARSWSAGCCSSRGCPRSSRRCSTRGRRGTAR